MDALIALAVFALLVLPPGYAALRWARSSEAGLDGLAVAAGLGLALALPLVLLELRLGGPFLVWPVALSSLAWLRPWRHWPAALTRLAPDLACALGLGALLYLVNAGDYSRSDGQARLRLGFETTDRVYYALVADELLRSPPTRLENPAFAPIPLRYSLFPSLAAILARRYALTDGLAAALWAVPAVCGVFLGLAVTGLLAAWGRPRGTRGLTLLLVALGGDLSFLASTANRTGLDRARHFFAFQSFSAESLFYNPWVLGLPLALCALILGGRWLAGGSRRELLLASLVLAGLWQTKVFAFMVLVAAALAAGWFHRRLWALAAVALLAATPWILLTLLSPGSGDGAPLLWAPLHAVRLSSSVNQTLAAAAGVLGEGPQRTLLATLIFLLGAYGLRLAGATRLRMALRADDSGVHAWIACAIALGTLASLVVRGNPMGINGIQFLTFALYLAWLYAGPALAAARRPLAALLVALAVTSPVGYVARKLAPERWTAPDSLDREWVLLDAATLQACEWLRVNAPASDRVVLSLDPTPGDRGILKPLIVAALAHKRLAAFNVPFGVSQTRLAERRRLADSIYAEADPRAVASAISGLQADWIWAEDARPLRATPSCITPHDAAAGVRLWRVRPGDCGAAR